MAALGLHLWLACVLVCQLPVIVLAQDMSTQTCSRDNTAIIQENVTAWIGGIISLNKPGTDGYGCGAQQGSMQAYEALRWVLDTLNKKGERFQTELQTDYYVPGIRLGMKVINYCNRPGAAVAALSSVYPELEGDQVSCSTSQDDFLLGIIGPSRSGDAADLLEASSKYKIPVVSYEATSPILTEAGRYKYFLRTIAPDGPLYGVIAQVLQQVRWDFVAVVYDSGLYGRDGFAELRERLDAAGICLTAGIMVDATDLNNAKSAVDQVLNTEVVGVIYIGPPDFAKQLVAEGDARLPDSGQLQWLFTDLPTDMTFPSSSRYQRGILSVTSAYRVLAEFESHWVRLDEETHSNSPTENPWFARWYEEKYDCSFTPTGAQRDCTSLYGTLSEDEIQLMKRRAFRQDQFVEPAVLSVITYARALREAQRDKCGAVSGACPALRNMTRDEFFNNYLSKVDFIFSRTERVPSLSSNNVAPYNAFKNLSFTPNGDINDPSYYIWNFNDVELGAGNDGFQFRRVGTYIRGRLNLNNVIMYSNNRSRRVDPVPSPCPTSVCSPCLSSDASRYYYEGGDVVINGIFSLHNMGDRALTCGGPVSENQFQYLQAMIYAIGKVNADSTILRNIKLGGLGFDDCSSTTLGQAFLAQVQRGTLQITNSQGGDLLDPRTIEAYTAAYDTPLSIPLAEAMNQLLKPMVGYSAGGDELYKYPYYIFAKPGVREEMTAIIMLLKKWNWNFVQLISSHRPYSMDAEKVFRALAAREGICVVATHTMTAVTNSSYDVIRGLQANENVQPVISLLETKDIPRLLMALNDNPAVRKKIALIGTTQWCTKTDIVKGYETVADGVISIRVRRSTLAQFRDHMASLDWSTYKTNPWFAEFYQMVHNCTLGGFTVSKADCNLNLDITTGPYFKLISGAQGVINAVYAIARGLDTTLQTYCGVGYTSVCTAFSNANKGQALVTSILQASFPIEDLTSPNTFSFTGRTARLPFELYNYRNGAYEEVGLVDPWAFTIQQLDIFLYDSISLNEAVTSCPLPCLECLYMFNYLEYWHIPGDLYIAGLFDVHYAGNGPFNCGPVRAKNGALYTELFNFALQRINSGRANVKLDNFALGGLAFDSCTNPNRATAIVNKVHTDLKNLIDEKNNEVTSKRLMAWMTYDSESTIQTAELLQALNMPVVSPAATAVQLDDKSKFFTFFRTVPRDSLVVRGMADFVREMRWRYVVVVNSPDTANREARDLFRTYLTEVGICVVGSYEFETDGADGIILQSIMATKTEVVAMFSEPDRYVEDFIKTKAQGGYFGKITYIANRPWGGFTRAYTGSNTVNKDLVNSVFFELPTPTIQDFITYLDQSSDANPWYHEIYEEWLNCNMPSSFYPRREDCNSNILLTSAPDFEQDIWTLTSLNAIYSIAKAVNTLKVERCGASSQGICETFYQGNPTEKIISNLDAVNFTDISNLYFQFVQREADRGLRLMRYSDGGNTIDMGGLSSSGSLSLTNKDSTLELYNKVVSNCSVDCLVCSATDSLLQDFSFIPGRAYIVGLFDVHKKGATPFTCGAINEKHGIQLLEAFNYAINYVNSDTGMFRDILNGITLGGIGLDMCQSPTRAANLVANIQSGKVKLVKDGRQVDARRIDAYIATMDTESSIRVADILTQISIPQISYGATGVELLDREKYNFFLRSVPADDKQARAIVSYLKKFKYNNIQVVYSFDEIGEPGLEEFEKVAFANTICVKKTLLVGENGTITTGDTSRFIQSLLTPEGALAEVVIVWMKNPLPILEAASANQVVSSSYLFIVTDKWGADPTYLKNSRLGNLLGNRTLVTLDVETADIPGFDEYLDEKTPDNYISNPWFKEYFEYLQKCYWDVANGIHKQQCDKSSTVPRADDYVQDPYVLYVINAVFSAAVGINNAVNSLCESGEFCVSYETSGERRQHIMRGLQAVNFTDDTFQPFFYTPDGQSDRGFHIYNVTKQAGEFVYTNVGSYNDTNFLKLDITYDTDFKAVCSPYGDEPNLEKCVCEFPVSQPSRYMKKDEGQRGLTLVYIGDIHQSHPMDPLACGPINTGPDLQKLLAFFYAIDRVNNNNNENNGFNLPDSVKLNGLALDSCTHGLRLGQDVYNLLSGNQLCDTDTDSELVTPNSIVSFVIDKDKNAIPVSSMLTEYKITSISPTAGSDMLNDRFTYPYFLRTRGDYSGLADVILRIAGQAQWDYVSVIYSDNLSQSSAKNALMDQARGRSVCVGDAEPLSMDATLSDAERVLETISQQVGARGVVLFVEPAHLKLILQASQSLGLTGRFVWVIPSDWSHDGGNIDGLEQEIAGSIRIETRSAILQDFTNYVRSLTFTNRGGIPDDWFLEIYQTLHQCNVLNMENTVRRYSKICSLDERITDTMVAQDPAVLHVILSVLSTAVGLSDIPQCRSNDDLDLAACLQVLGDERFDLIYDRIRGVNFAVFPNQLGDNSFQFAFQPNGNGNSGYDIINYRATNSLDRVNNNNVIPQYAAFKLGSYRDSVMSLDLSTYASGNLLNQGTVPSSNCAKGDTCYCKLSDGRTWSFTPAPLLNPADVQVGKTYEDPESGEAVFVIGVPTTTDRFEDKWAINLAVIAGVGATVSLALFIFLLVMYPVRGGTSILGFILCFGIVLLYLMAFAFIAHADEQICGLRRFGLGFVYAIVYSALLVKLVDCWRVRGKAESYDVKYSKLGRPAGLFMVTVFFVLIQVMINAEWLILREPGMTRFFYNGYFWPRCTPHDFYDESLVLSLIYVMVLIVFSLLLGIATFTSTKNHRESRWILALLILTVPCWVIWCLVATIGAYKVRDAAVAMGLITNASLILLLVPVRKVYLLFKYNLLIKEEEASELEDDKRSQLTQSQRGGYYNTMYGRQYDNNPRLQDNGSNIGSTRAY